MKKRIFAVLLVAAVILSLAMFASCNNEPAEEEIEEEPVSITVRIKITGDDGNVLVDEDVQMTDLPSKLTALAATTRVLEIDEIDHEEQDGMFERIAEYDNYEYSDEEKEEKELSADLIAGMFWMIKINGSDSVSSATLLKDGDNIEWTFKEEVWQE